MRQKVRSASIQVLLVFFWEREDHFLRTVRRDAGAHKLSVNPRLYKKKKKQKKKQDKRKSATAVGTSNDFFYLHIHCPCSGGGGGGGSADPQRCIHLVAQTVRRIKKTLFKVQFAALPSLKKKIHRTTPLKHRHTEEKNMYLGRGGGKRYPRKLDMGHVLLHKMVIRGQIPLDLAKKKKNWSGKTENNMQIEAKGGFGTSYVYVCVCFIMVCMCVCGYACIYIYMYIDTHT